MKQYVVAGVWLHDDIDWGGGNIKKEKTGTREGKNGLFQVKKWPQE